MESSLIARLRADRLLIQLILAFITPTLLVGLLIGISLIESRRAALMAQEQRRAAQAGEAAALLFSERLQSGVQLANLLADRQILTEQMRAGNRSQLQLFLERTRGDTPFSCLAIADVSGTFLARDGGCFTIETAWSPVAFQSAVGAGLRAQIAAPIVLDGTLRGQLIGVIPIDQGLVDAARRQPDLELGVVVDGRSVASSLATRGTVNIPLLATDNPAEILIQGQPYLAHYTLLTDLQSQPVAYAEVLLPLAPVWAAQLNVTLILLAQLAAAVALASALSWLIARRISRLIDHLCAVTAAIGRGDLERPSVVHGPVEIRQLSGAIEHMRQQLAQSRSELEAEKQRYADILESIDEAVLTIDAELHVTSMNKGGEMMLSCPRSKAVGLPLSALISPDDGRPLTLATLPPHSSLRIAVRTYGRQTMMISATRSSSPGRDEQILVLRDVSDDAAIRQLKEAFLANITHEFRTPLAAQIASLEILREEDENLTVAERRQMLEALHSGVQRLDMLVQNLLDSASIEAGYFWVDPEPCRLEMLVSEAVTLILPLLRQRGQRIQVQIPALLPPVFADDQRMVQVLLNLLANASKFGPHGDTLLLEAAYAHPSCVTLRVTDHGPGVPNQRRDRLFERFVRPGIETIPSQGAGLGLAIVKAIMDRHGGTVAMETTATPGTTFCITIPIAGGFR